MFSRVGGMGILSVMYHLSVCYAVSNHIVFVIHSYRIRGANISYSLVCDIVLLDWHMYIC